MRDGAAAFHAGLDAIPDDLPADEKIRLALRAHLRTVAGQLDVATVFTREWRYLEGERREEILAERRRYEERFRALFREGRELGELRTDLDDAASALLALSAANWAYTWLTPERDTDALADRFCDVLLDGLRGYASRLFWRPPVGPAGAARAWARGRRGVGRGREGAGRGGGGAGGGGAAGGAGGAGAGVSARVAGAGRGAGRARRSPSAGARAAGRRLRSARLPRRRGRAPAARGAAARAAPSAAGRGWGVGGCTRPPASGGARRRRSGRASPCAALGVLRLQLWDPRRSASRARRGPGVVLHARVVAGGGAAFSLDRRAPPRNGGSRRSRAPLHGCGRADIDVPGAGDVGSVGSGLSCGVERADLAPVAASAAT